MKTKFRQTFVCFDIFEQKYAIPAEQLAGVAQCCPALAYAGFSGDTAGLVLWDGRIFPILSVPSDPSDFGKLSSAEKQSFFLDREVSFLFSTSIEGSRFTEFAFAVRGRVWATQNEKEIEDRLVINIDEVEKKQTQRAAA